MTRKIEAATRRSFGRGAFHIEILFPGEGEDTGLGTIGRIDRGRLLPGAFVAMHPHRDDEILSYLRQGTLQHQDSTGRSATLTPAQLMLMNAGRGFYHEERVPDEGGSVPVEMLQIFLRPEREGLEPRVQFHTFAAPESRDAWRRIAGPDPTDPLQIRTRTWVLDTGLTAGHALALPPLEGRMALLHVFSGAVHSAGHSLTEGDSLVTDEPLTVTARESSALLLLLTDLRAPASRAGMFSGLPRKL
jgi:quercetin 2,3-dioxygenase